PTRPGWATAPAAAVGAPRWPSASRLPRARRARACLPVPAARRPRRAMRSSAPRRRRHRRPAARARPRRRACPRLELRFPHTDLVARVAEIGGALRELGLHVLQLTDRGIALRAQLFDR